jgi:hypothetical protein
MAIGSLDKAGRIDQLRTFARCLVWSGYRSDDEVRAELYDAALGEERTTEAAAALAEELFAEANRALDDAAAGWPAATSFDRLQRAADELRSEGVVVLESVDDHWAAAEALDRLAAEGRRPVGIAYFSAADVWHAVEHGMLEINVWHGDSANVAPGDRLLDLVIDTLARAQIPAAFDEGRIEARLDWQRRRAPADVS